MQGSAETTSHLLPPLKGEGDREAVEWLSVSSQEFQE